MSATDIAEAQLKIDEGLRLKPYTDQKGKLTIGYGHNLTDDGISNAQAEDILNDDVNHAAIDAFAIFPNLFDLDDARQAVLINMTFNLGKASLLEFRALRSAIAQKDYEAAAVAMEESSWYNEVGARAQRLVIIMRGA